jgi:hypothetical protein
MINILSLMLSIFKHVYDRFWLLMLIIIDNLWIS